MPGSALVMLNPHAAGGRAARLALPLREACNARGVPLQAAAGVAAARELLMQQPEGTRAVLVGGDGTLHQMLPALLARSLTLGLVPLGSGNDTARALGLHRLDWHDALAFALEGQARPIDTGELVVGTSAAGDTAGVPFISSLAAGFDAAVAIRAHAAPRWLIGMPRYLWATLQEVAALRNTTVRVWADGQALHDGSALFVSTLNTASYGSGMPAVPHARIADGRLDLLLAGHFKRLATLAMLPRLLAGAHLTHPRVKCLAVRELRVEAAAPLPLAADGEVLASAARFTVRVRPAALQAVARG